MTPSQQCKALGCPSVAAVACSVNVAPNTLARWYHSRRRLFDAVCRGYVIKDQSIQAAAQLLANAIDQAVFDKLSQSDPGGRP